MRKRNPNHPKTKINVKESKKEKPPSPPTGEECAVGKV
jgi:hypothetical protein